MDRSKMVFPNAAKKLGYALDMMHRARGRKGVWATANADSRYGNTCWMRDFAYCLAPLLLKLGEDDLVRTHLENVSALQRPNGQIPIVFLDDEAAWLDRKLRQEREAGRKPFMLQRYEEGELWNLTPGTRDSELCYLLAMYTYAEATGDEAFLERWKPQMDAAYAYIETNLVRDGLVIGCDWRDTMHEELGDKPLLTNNMLWFAIRELHGDYGGIASHCERIHEAFYVPPPTGQDESASLGRLVDYPGSERPDPLGAAFVILHGGTFFRDTVMWDAALKTFRDLSTPFGVTIKCKHKPAHGGRADEAEVIERTNGVVVWPFVQAFVVRALLGEGRREYREEGLRQLQVLHAHPGFDEWFDPSTGIGYGAPEQLWSAAGYALAFLETLKCR